MKIWCQKLRTLVCQGSSAKSKLELALQVAMEHCRLNASQFIIRSSPICLFIYNSHKASKLIYSCCNTGVIWRQNT
uniref:Uncharacterized protein n=1 Tax=Arundo donax TaxID=35708 RepID=A0A0A9FQW3_ARUDO